MVKKQIGFVGVSPAYTVIHLSGYDMSVAPSMVENVAGNTWIYDEEGEFLYSDVDENLGHQVATFLDENNNEIPGTTVEFFGGRPVRG